MSGDLFGPRHRGPAFVHCEGCDRQQLAPMRNDTLPMDWHACGVSAKWPAQPYAYWCPTCWPTSPHMKGPTP